MNSSSRLPPWSRAFGEPPVRATVRAVPEDFQVDEDLGFAPDGEGGHVLLHIRKRNANTDWVARRLGQMAGVRPVDVGYAGLKDRNAVTSQWFSVNLAGRPEPDWNALAGDGIEVMAVTRHRRKLRRGCLRGNRFHLVLRGVEGSLDALERRLALIAERGVPNYFGEQRFGRDGRNLEQARALLCDGAAVKDRHKRGLYLSAGRSLLFNEVLSARVAEDCWDRGLPGDALMLEGSHSFFVADELDDVIRDRIARQDLHPTGPLWGRGDLPCRLEAAELERRVLSGRGDWCSGLERAGLTQERRSLRLRVTDLAWNGDGNGTFRLTFTLPAGAYATTVLRELAADRADDSRTGSAAGVGSPVSP